MKKFNGEKKKKSFFEGWYFKHQNEEDTIAFIPGINILDSGEKTAFIQIITKDFSKYIEYSFNSFYADKKRLYIKIGKNTFSEKGIDININEEGLTIKGKIEYGNFTPLKYNIMGPFSLIPFMECNHGVISLSHKIEGKLIINDKIFSFKEGNGYIEKDYGTSFPKSYLWVQCNDFKDDTSIMVSIADIPFMGMNFKGCIGVVYYRGREYRLATYNGVKIISYSKNGLEIKRGKYRLVIDIEENNPKLLMAPVLGEMNRHIHENEACTANFKFYIKDRLIFALESSGVGFEYVNY